MVSHGNDRGIGKRDYPVPEEFLRIQPKIKAMPLGKHSQGDPWGEGLGANRLSLPAAIAGSAAIQCIESGDSLTQR